MVLLKNIKKTDTDISAEYYPNGNENDRGFMRLRLSDGEEIEHERATTCIMSPTHVRRELREIIDWQGDIPEEERIYWY